MVVVGRRRYDAAACGLNQYCAENEKRHTKNVNFSINMVVVRLAQIARYAYEARWLFCRKTDSQQKVRVDGMVFYALPLLRYCRQKKTDRHTIYYWCTLGHGKTTTNKYVDGSERDTATLETIQTNCCCKSIFHGRGKHITQYAQHNAESISFG